MTLKELAALLGINPDSLRVQVHRERLAAEKVGRDWVVSDGEAERYIRENAGKRGTSSPLHPGTGGRPPKPKGEVE